VLEAFGIAAPAASDLGIIVALGVFVTITIEITKAVLRAKAPVARERSLHNSAAGQHSYIALGKQVRENQNTFRHPFQDRELGSLRALFILFLVPLHRAGRRRGCDQAGLSRRGCRSFLREQ